MCKRVLVTGAAGFVGGHLIRRLKRQEADVNITAWVMNEAEAEMLKAAIKEADGIEIVDITDESRVRRLIADNSPDVVYHLAAQSSVGLSWKMPALTYEVNLIGTTHLLEALKESAPKALVMLIGSAEQYGAIAKEELPVSETHALMGKNPYSISKMAQEAAAELYLKNTELSIIRVRAFNHIGPGQDTKFVIPDWCSQVIRMERGQLAPVLKVGDISVKRDFTDVRDIVNAYVLLSEHGQSGEIYNVGRGESRSLEEVLRIIISCSQIKNITWETDQNRLRPTETPELCADIDKLRQTIEWSPQITLRRSIEDILASLRAQ